MNARETAERHATYATSGQMQNAAADFTPEAMQAFTASGLRPPRRANKWEIVREQQDGSNHIFDIKYTNDEQESATIRSTWSQIGDDWKLVKAESA